MDIPVLIDIPMFLDRATEKHLGDLGEVLWPWPSFLGYISNQNLGWSIRVRWKKLVRGATKSVKRSTRWFLVGGHKKRPLKGHRSLSQKVHGLNHQVGGGFKHSCVGIQPCFCYREDFHFHSVFHRVQPDSGWNRQHYATFFWCAQLLWRTWQEGAITTKILDVLNVNVEDSVGINLSNLRPNKKVRIS